MGRVIKFRAWEAKSGRMISINERNHLILMGDKKWKIFDKVIGCQSWASWNDKHLVLMQFTGLLDKNGKEIYEGDIVKGILIDDSILYPKEVVFNKGSFKLVRALSPEHCLEIRHYRDMEVIGNIYENPELLEAK